jgi:hypothetical protein
MVEQQDGPLQMQPKDVAEQIERSTPNVSEPVTISECRKFAWVRGRRYRLVKAEVIE